MVFFLAYPLRDAEEPSCKESDIWILVVSTFPKGLTHDPSRSGFARFQHFRFQHLSPVRKGSQPKPLLKKKKKRSTACVPSDLMASDRELTTSPCWSLSPPNCLLIISASFFVVMGLGSEQANWFVSMDQVVFGEILQLLQTAGIGSSSHIKGTSHIG